MKKFFLLNVLIFLNFLSFSQNYKIELRENILQKNDTLYLGHYFGGRKIIVDTAIVENKGNVIFQKEKNLRSGLYFIVFPQKKHLEILIDEDKSFVLETKFPNLLDELKVIGSEENTIFYNFQRKLKTQNQELNSLDKKINDKNKSETKEKRKKIRLEKEKDIEEIIRKYPNSLLSSMLKSMVETEIPDFPRDENGNVKDSLFRYKYYKKHYFDHINFTDERLILTPIIFNKITNFFENVMSQNPEILLKEVIFLIEKSRVNENVFQYVLSLSKSYFENSLSISYENIFVALCEKYYLKGLTNWLSKKELEKMKTKVERMKPNLVGEIAPNITLPDIHGEYFALNQIEADYTLLYFWTSHCSHCQSTTPILRDKILALKQEFKQKFKNIEIMAVYLENNDNELELAINNYDIQNWLNLSAGLEIAYYKKLYNITALPSLYLLDKDKKILVKNFDAEILENLIYFFERQTN